MRYLLPALLRTLRQPRLPAAVAIAGLVGFAAAAALDAPLRRASRVDPVSVLRAC